MIKTYFWVHSGSTVEPVRSWGDRLDSFDIRWIPVERPGRGARWGEDAAQDMDALTDATIEHLVLNIGSSTFALAGHSLGALIAYEMAQRLRHQYALRARWLFVSGHWPPDAMGSRPRLDGETPDELADAALAELARLGGTPPEMLAHPAARRLLVPPMIADSLIGNRYIHQHTTPLDTPITAISATGDQQVSVAAMRGWQRHTTAGFRQHVLAGDHFAIYQPDNAPLDYLRDMLIPVDKL